VSIACSNLYTAAEAWAKIVGYGQRTDETDLVLEEALHNMGFVEDALEGILSLHLLQMDDTREVIVHFVCGLKLTIPLERRVQPR
jgi:hypothetical protein